MKPYLTGVSDIYLCKITSKARKINKLFSYEYDLVTLQKIKGIGRHMIQWVIYSADRISKLTNLQIDYIIEQVESKTIIDQSRVNEISESVAITSAHDSDNNFSDTSDLTNYFKKKEGTNKSTEEVFKKSEVCASTMSILVEDDYYKMILKDCAKDCTYFDFTSQSVKEMNKEVASLSEEETDESRSDNENNSSSFEEEMPDKSDDDGYDGYGRYNEYGKCDRGYYYHNGGYERKTSSIISPIISPVTA